jgi:hypothetical protein
MTPYYLKVVATYGDFQVEEHVLAGHFQVRQVSSNETFRAISFYAAKEIARIQDRWQKEKAISSLAPASVLPIVPPASRGA